MTLSPSREQEQEFEAQFDDNDISTSPPTKRFKQDLKPWSADMFAHLTGEDIPEVVDHTMAFDDNLPPSARKCPIAVRRMIHNAYRNLGHPSNYALHRLMKMARCHVDMLEYLQHMKCPTCLRRKAPERIPRVAMPYRPTRFNAVVGLDLKYAHDASGKQFMLLNILDLATCFNLAVPLESKSAEQVARALKLYWLQWASSPEKVIVDQGTEFHGDFKDAMSQLGIAHRMIPVEAPWQHGMVERHGDVIGEIVAAAVKDTSVHGMDQMKDVCLYASMAKNRRPGKTGYSPRSLVFGIDEKLIASGLNHYLEEPDDASVLHHDRDPVAKRTMEFRLAAMKKVVEMDHDGKWAQAIKYPSRVDKTRVSMFLPGHQVFFWKKASPNQAKNAKEKKRKQQANEDPTTPHNKDQTGHDNTNPLKGRMARRPERWFPLTGPAIVIGHEWDEKHQCDAYWLSYGGTCTLVPGSHMRHAEMEELMADDKFFKELKSAFTEATKILCPLPTIGKSLIKPWKNN